jgi:hypothetical protein
MTRLNAICDLSVPAESGLRMRKVRGVPAAHHRMAVALARAEREYEGWSSSEAIGETTEAGALSPEDRTRIFATGVLFAYLYDANADPVVLECIGSATPILVNRHPGAVQYLGPEYPLYFESLEDAARKILDIDAIESAHRHLCADEVRHRVTPDAFLSAIHESAVYAGLG